MARPPDLGIIRMFLCLGELVAALTFCPVAAGQVRSATLVRFGVITDVHYADVDSRESRFYRAALGKVDVFTTTMNSLPRRPDFVIELGDFKDTDISPNKDRDKNRLDTLRDLETVERHFARFQGPRYHVLGNHDMDVISKTEFQARVTNSGIDRAKTYYSYDVGGVHFVVLDGCFKSDGTPYDAGKFNWIDSNVPPAELAWLQSDLAATRAPTVAFLHQRLDLADTHELNVKNGSRVRQILENSARVIAVFNGHDHLGGCQTIHGVSYVTLKGNIEAGPDDHQHNAFAVVDVNRLDATHFTVMVDGYYRQPDYTLRATIAPEGSVVRIRRSR